MAADNSQAPVALRLILDSRERALIATLADATLPAGVEMHTTTLDIGDIHISTSDGQVLLALERKTYADLIASVRDSRYVEQKQRALDNLGSGRYAYILEGASRSFAFAPESACCGYVGPEAKTLQTCVINSMLRDGLRVFFTADIADTAALALGIAERAASRGDPVAYFRGLQQLHPDTGGPDAAYKSSLQVKRRDNLCSPRTIAELQVAQIPSVSVTNAVAILDAFNVQTLAQLARVIDNVPDRRARIKALMAVPKVGKAKAERILDMLFPSSL